MIIHRRPARLASRLTWPARDAEVAENICFMFAVDPPPTAPAARATCRVVARRAKPEAGGEKDQAFQLEIRIIMLRESAESSKLFKLCLGIIIVFAGHWAYAKDQAGYLSVSGPCHMEFPRDHGPHPGYRTEWWYYTGNLASDEGNRYGFQFTVFRTQITPPGFKEKWPQPPSAWRSQQIYLGHAAITDISGQRHLQAEQAARAALGLAEAAQKGDKTDIYINDWSLKITMDSHTLKVISDDFAYELTFYPEKPPVLHGDAGYSRKGLAPERASCYYSFTRLKANGTIHLAGRPVTVKGTSWMDHEFSTAALEPGLVGWDWFSLQLSDHTEIMFFLLREDDGKMNPVSSGSFVDVSGAVRHLVKDDFKVDVLKTWKSPHTHAVYPAQWRVQIYPLSIDLILSPTLPDQEMQTLKSTGVSYWEGSVVLKGTKQALPVDGQGYVELTGYAGTFKAPM